MKYYLSAAVVRKLQLLLGIFWHAENPAGIKAMQVPTCNGRRWSKLYHYTELVHRLASLVLVGVCFPSYPALGRKVESNRRQNSLCSVCLPGVRHDELPTFLKTKKSFKQCHLPPTRSFDSLL